MRYLRSRRKGLLSFLAAISIAGISLSVFGFVVIASVMNGFSDKMQRALIGFGGHLIVSPRADDDIQSIKDFLQKKAVAMHESLEVDGVVFAGEDATVGVKIREVSADFLRQPQLSINWFEPYSPSTWNDADEPGILVGEGVMEKLALSYVESPVVSLMNPFGELAPTGEVVPRRQEVKILGTFSTGYYDFDQHSVMMSAPWGNYLAGVLAPDARTLRVYLKNYQDAPSFEGQVHQQFPNTPVSTWQKQNRKLLSALTMERFGMGLLLTLVTLITTFNVLGLMSLYHASKESEKNLLLALGLTASEVRHVFTRLGLWVSLLGSVPGLVLGLFGVFYLQRYPLPLPEAYYMGALPVKLPLLLLVLFIGLLFTVTTAAAWWAARSQREPGLVLRGMY